MHVNFTIILEHLSHPLSQRYFSGPSLGNHRLGQQNKIATITIIMIILIIILIKMNIAILILIAIIITIVF